MKKILAGLMLCVMLLPAALYAETLEVVADEWCPYNCAEDDKLPGFGIEILQAAFKSSGIEIKYKVMDWDAAIEETRAGKHNAIIGALQSDAPDFIFPDEEIALTSTNFFVLKENSWRYSGIDSLKGKRIGIIEAYSYGDALDEYISKNPQAVLVAKGNNALDDLIDKLLAREIDAIVEDNFVFLLKSREKKLFGKVINAGAQSDNDAVYIAFSPAVKTSKRHAEVLTKGIASLRSSGKLAVIWRSMACRTGRPGDSRHIAPFTSDRIAGLLGACALFWRPGSYASIWKAPYLYDPFIWTGKWGAI